MAVPNPLHILLHVFDLPFVSTTANFHFHLVTEIDRSRNAAAMGRAPCCDKAAVKRGSWSAEEDAKLKSYIEQHGTGGNWISLPQKIGLKRCGKSCRLRWLNYLRPNIKHGKFSEEEDDVISRLYFTIGSRWSVIAAQLPGRTDNDVKNHWNTRLKKKLHLGKQQNRHRRRQALPRRAGEPCSQDEAGIRSHYETQPPPSGVSFSSSCPSAPAPASTSHAEASESSNGFLEPLNDYTLIPFESTELGEMDCLYGVAGMDWNETSPFMCLNQQAEGSHGMLHLQHQFAEPAMHLIQRAPR